MTEKGAPVFVKVDDYKELLDVLDMIKAKINEVKQTIDSLNSLREEEDSELQAWISAVNDIQSRVDDIDKMMYEPDQQY